MSCNILLLKTLLELGESRYKFKDHHGILSFVYSNSISGSRDIIFNRLI